MTGALSRPAVAAWIDLGRAGDFPLGALSVRPRLRQIVLGERAISLQPRIMQVLVALAQARDEIVSRDDLVDACWGGAAVSDDAINRCIQKLRRLALSEAGGAFTIETVFGVGYRLSCPGAAAVEAEPASRPRRMPTARPWRVPALLAAALLVCVLAASLLFELMRPPQARLGIVVAPFQPAGPDPLTRGVAKGIANAVAGELARSDVKVATASGPGIGADRARPAGVALDGRALVLDGLVQADDKSLELDARVEGAGSRVVLWSANFSRPLGERQALQAQAAAKIADVLHCALNPRNFQGWRVDEQTLRLFLRACDLARDPASPDKVRDLFKQITVREPRVAAAWSSLALAGAAAVLSEPDDDPLTATQTASFVKEARTAAETALRLDPRDGDAYVALHDLEPRDGAFAKRQQYLSRGLALQPDNALLNDRQAQLLCQLGRQDEGLAYAHRAVNLDPLSPDLSEDLAADLASEGSIVAARAEIERAGRMWPDRPLVRRMRMAMEARIGDPDRALALLADVGDKRPNYEPPELERWRDLALARKSHDPAQARALVREILANFAAGRIYPADAMLNLENLGAVDQVFAVAAQARPTAPLDPEILFRSFADGVRRDPRFMPLAAKLGLVDDWRSSGKWPDFCSEPQISYDCRVEAERVVNSRRADGQAFTLTKGKD
jgi:DNA-binding winged helix-turn-helix (wHTH) protein/TolB-like protein/Tfp pilus assembly protein PilF